MVTYRAPARNGAMSPRFVCNQTFLDAIRRDVAALPSRRLPW